VHPSERDDALSLRWRGQPRVNPGSLPARATPRVLDVPPAAWRAPASTLSACNREEQRGSIAGRSNVAAGQGRRRDAGAGSASQPAPCGCPICAAITFAAAACMATSPTVRDKAPA